MNLIDNNGAHKGRLNEDRKGKPPPSKEESSTGKSMMVFNMEAFITEA